MLAKRARFRSLARCWADSSLGSGLGLCVFSAQRNNNCAKLVLCRSRTANKIHMWWLPRIETNVCLWDASPVVNVVCVLPACRSHLCCLSLWMEYTTGSSAQHQIQPYAHAHISMACDHKFYFANSTGVAWTYCTGVAAAASRNCQ
jgi:hypothetical protein